jgi:putative peptidoglycan lipid II flippase
MLIGQALLSLTTIVDQFFAARLAPGAIATLSYANRIVALILGLGATAVNRATLPVFSKGQATGSQDVGHVATRWAQLLFGLGLIAVGVGWWFAPWCVRTLFERGAFTAHDTQAVTQVLRYALVQIPFYISALVFVSFISSSHSYGTLAFLGFIGLIVKILGNATLVSRMGLNGLVLTNTLVYGVNFTVLAVAMKLGRLQNTKPEIHAL